MLDDGICVCGHFDTEHRPEHECEVEGCLCAMFEPEDDEEA